MFLVVSCATSVTVTSPPTILPDISIARHPEPVDWSGFSVYNYPPVYDPKSTERWQVDLRSSDLTKLDLSKSTSDLLFADFDSKTQWPDADKMPTDFDWQKSWKSTKTRDWEFEHCITRELLEQEWESPLLIRLCSLTILNTRIASVCMRRPGISLKVG